MVERRDGFSADAVIAPRKLNGLKASGDSMVPELADPGE
jgi:hypothetical protein